MKKLILSLPILFAFIVVLSSCGGKNPVEPSVKEKLTKTFTVSIAKEAGVEVYNKTKATNIEAGYSYYKLSLTSSGAATLTAKDNSTFTGSWTLTNTDKTLSLTGLKNAAGSNPTGTTGTIEFTIVSIDGTGAAVTLESLQADIKAGNKIVNLQLVNP
ncbi:hypothetical protein VB264_01540 [Arcicella aquatica]|uniref:Lipocalin-like domain-containing protein n=1 Tax=Arcicella aquatica TaxID=217141 RepID=A0ABU5QI91_9BACT|nr:hypothetical protein [Arcicella aquatica]MEA5256444.1 hypothetical protein [Arcicella aquatica]